MAPRRRALRDHGDARPLVALARAAMREAAEASRAAREGLERHLRIDDDCRIIGGITGDQSAGRRGRGDAGSRG